MEYSTFTVAELKNIAASRNMRVASSASKGDLIGLLERYDTQERILEELRAKEAAEERMHQASRNLELRQAEVDIACLEYPFSFIRSGEYPRICDALPGQPEEDIGNFPDNIAHYYWVQPGENDETPWLCLCRLTNDVYVYYRGECDYTGFDCQGCMKLYASRAPAILIQMAMTCADYDAYLATSNASH